ncbi:hypothetical protein GKE82_21050 [Conexibacter sp. W3-3-2]|uniref:recombinase family protein n=1 Tax=Conexibacter sp. W3-3-2 TaxID=2675227 RepID=UPI0012B976EA|nr:recombinase family protein [Conexibacter sp. W3-3-2]MTD46709.1 hypothetical protein [Conexibacter sp. W3-3-2]
MERAKPVAAVYARVARNESDDEQVSINRQQQECAAAATRLGIDVVAGFVDTDDSGTSLLRPGLGKLFGWLDWEANEGRVTDYVAVASTERLAQRSEDLTEVLRQLGKRGIRLLIAENDSTVETSAANTTNKELTIRDVQEETPATAEQPEHDQLDESEIDLTGVVEQTESLMDVIGDALIEAGDDGEVPEWGARAMARLLANLLGESGSALHHFAVTGQGTFEQIGQDLDVLWEDPDRTEVTSEVINRLATYLITVERKAHQERAGNFSETTRALIAEHGPAFEAFLQLPDVTENNALHGFHEVYYRSFDSLEAVAQDVAESHEVYQLLEEASLSHVASPDQRLLLKLARQRWDIVPHNKRLYLFEK